jgi:hypothetical protein
LKEREKDGRIKLRGILKRYRLLGLGVHGTESGTYSRMGEI